MRVTKKEFLSQAFWLNKLIDSDTSELQELQHRKTALTSPQFTTSGDKTKGEAGYTKVVDKIVDLEKKISEELEEYIAIKNCIRETINSIDDPGRLILKLRYINLMRWEDIADAMGYTVRNTQIIHKQALRQVKIKIL